MWHFQNIFWIIFLSKEYWKAKWEKFYFPKAFSQSLFVTSKHNPYMDHFSYFLFHSLCIIQMNFMDTSVLGNQRLSKWSRVQWILIRKFHRNKYIMPVIQSEEEKGEELGFPPILSFKFYSFGLELLHFTDLVSPLLCENTKLPPMFLFASQLSPVFWATIFQLWFIVYFIDLQIFYVVLWKLKWVDCKQTFK